MEDKKKRKGVGCVIVMSVVFAILGAIRHGWITSDLWSSSKPSAEIELKNLYGEWEEVITVHGYYDDEEAAEEIVEVMNRELGRTYRVKEK